MGADTCPTGQHDLNSESDARRCLADATRSSSTVDLKPGDTILVEGVLHITAGPAFICEVSQVRTPGGHHFVTTSRGTFLAEPDRQHTVLGPEPVATPSCGDGSAATPRSTTRFAKAAAACGYDLNSEADAAAARACVRVWDLVWADIEAGQ